MRRFRWEIRGFIRGRYFRETDVKMPWQIDAEGGKRSMVWICMQYAK